MNALAKKGIALAALAALLAVCVYGNLLPLAKSRRFIRSMQMLERVSSLQEFEETMSASLLLASPTGQEELVRNVAGVITNVLKSPEGDNPAVVAALTRYLEAIYRPIIDRGKGMSFGQNLFVLGYANEAAFAKTKDPAYLEAAKKYYARGLSLSPKRPQFLYGLLEIAKGEKDTQAIRAVGGEILAYWPGDAAVRQTLAGLGDRQ